jgi:hypothetical protein
MKIHRLSAAELDLLYHAYEQGSIQQEGEDERPAGRLIRLGYARSPRGWDLVATRAGQLRLTDPERLRAIKPRKQRTRARGER